MNSCICAETFDVSPVGLDGSDTGVILGMGGGS